MDLGFFNKYPYTDFHELNLDWIISALKAYARELEEFVQINAIKYADPIQWDIMRQYEKNTVVIDPLTGTAYISVQAVPAGVSIARTDYWSVIFDLSRFITAANNNFTVRIETVPTTTATFNTAAGEWLVWNQELYKANVNITAGDAYVINSNITRITVEEMLQDLATTLQQITGDLSDLNTTDKSNLVAAINEVLAAVGAVASDLVNTDINIGDLNDLNTTDKSNLVAAINETMLARNNFVSPEQFGAIGDGVANDTAALQAALDNNMVYLAGIYRITSPLTVGQNSVLTGGGTILIDNQGGPFTALTLDNDVEIDNISFIDTLASYSQVSSENTAIINFTDKSGIRISNCTITDSHDRYVIYCDHSDDVDISFNKINGYGYGGIMLVQGCKNVVISNNSVIDARAAIGGYTYPICLNTYFSVVNDYADNFRVLNNVIDGSLWEAIDSHGVINAQIRGNIITNSPKGIVLTVPSNGITLPENHKNIDISDNVMTCSTAGTVQASGITVSGTTATSVMNNILIKNNKIVLSGVTTINSAQAAISVRQAVTADNVTVENNYCDSAKVKIWLQVQKLTNALIINNECVNGDVADAYGISLHDTHAFRAILIENNYIHDGVRGMRLSEVNDDNELIKIVNNIIDVSGDQFAYYSLTTAPRASINSTTLAKGLPGDFIPCNAVGAIAGWYCQGTGNWKVIPANNI